MDVINSLKSLRDKLPPMPTRPPTHEPSRSALLQLAILVGFATVMHFQIADIKVAIFAFAIFLLKAFIVFRKLAPPPKLILVLLTILSVGLIIYVYSGWNGQRAGISFLVLLASLKFLESHALRDYYITCLLLFFLASSSFLFNSSIPSIAMVVIYTIALTSILLQITNPNATSIRQNFSTSTAIIIKALPLAIILFFFFPRIHGSFGFLPSQDQQNAAGLSDALVAGEMAASAFNNQLAFRVEFKGGNIPPRSQLYWRVKTMTTERTFQWEVIKPNSSNANQHKIFQNNADLNNGQWFYDVLHEKTSDTFLPYLDYVSGYSIGNVLSDYSVFLSNTQLGSFSYKGSSSATPALNDKEKIDRIRFLQTDSRPNAKVQALLEQWKNTSDNDEGRTKAVYQYLLDNPFNYSLTPPGLDEFDPLSDFLLNTKTGYCEHYASAFTILMRWLRIPARVVVGYQGGTSVNDGQFLEVRYSDAHAWSEVWFNGRWNRVDPTAAISPDRIEYGMDALMEMWGNDYFGSNDTGLALSNYLNPTGTARFLKKLNDSWKNAGYQWNKWVVNYDFDTQKELLSRLGLKHKNNVLMLVLVMIAGAFSLMLLYFWQLIPKPMKRTDLQQSYLAFTRKFKKFGLVKSPSETPLEFSQRAVGVMPHLESQIKEITSLYYRLRYAKTNDDAKSDAIALKQRIKQFKIKSEKRLP